MWGESSQDCESNCQCSGLITENFRINSGSNSKKRKTEAASNNFKYKMNPYSIDFNSHKSPLNSPIQTPTKRRVLGELNTTQVYLPNFDRIKSPYNTSPIKSPLRTQIDRLKSPHVARSPQIDRLKSPQITRSPQIDRINSIFGQKSPIDRVNTIFDQKSPQIDRINSILGQKSPQINSFDRNSPQIDRVNAIFDRKSPLIDRNSSSPLTSRTLKRCTKISRIFEERTKFKMSNKENSPFMSETFMKLDVEEETRDCSFSERFHTQKVNFTMTKLDFTDTIPSKTYESDSKKTEDVFVPQEELRELTDELDEFETLHDLEEFDNTTFDQCNKYEIISTDSPDIISRGRSSSRKVTASNFEFGAPLSDLEQSTSFNKPNSINRMLNFEDESFEFTSPAVKRPLTSNLSVKKSLKFTHTPTKLDRSDSNISSISSTSSKRYPSDMSLPSPPSKLRFPSESTTSMESGFVSELEEPFLDIEEISNSPKLANFSELLSGEIKENFLPEKEFCLRRPLVRSLSFNPEASKARMSLFSISESPSKRSQKRSVNNDCGASKRRKSNQSPDLTEVKARPVLHRAFSENNASIMSALARSAAEPDLIGDFTLPFALPLTRGDHDDLKSISCDTLAALINGDYTDSIGDFQVIDCRYPYEYEGGHITGAVNLYTPAHILSLVTDPPPVPPTLPPTLPPALPPQGERRRILVFHCEFSLERGPKLSRFLRSSDRAKNKENYPSLHYPEVYLLHGGYRGFYQRYPALCSAGYTAMLDPKHKNALRRHRSLQPAQTRRNRLLL